MIKRKVCILLSVVMCFGVVACDFQESHKDEVKETLKGSYEEAVNTPFGRYPETITYTLGKEIGTNNSNMPEGDTYEDNAYTRYLYDLLNVQNVNIFEAKGDEYNTAVSMAIAMEQIPDIMVVNNYSDVMLLDNMGLLADLSDAYEKCASTSIKEMYESYGDELLDSVTVDGRLIAVPETNIEEGPNLLWLRKDWLDEQDLNEPENLEDVEHIVRSFIQYDSDRVGIVINAGLCGESGYSSQYLTDIIFANFNAYPKQWIDADDNTVCYGSVQPQAKEALLYISELYEERIIDENFLFRSTADIIELIEDGKCGSFFGPWWSPNNPLMGAIEKDKDAQWRPYLISTDESGMTTYHATNLSSNKYVVVRKDFEHPEIVFKILSVLFDYARYQDDEGSKELAMYDKNAVDPTARPFVINVDYRDALAESCKNIEKYLDNEADAKDVNDMEISYAQQCRAYLESGNNYTSQQWTAYMSRIVACRLISDEKVSMIKTYYVPGTPFMESEWWRLKELETDAYLRIVTGQVDISYFDEFVRKWYEMGGEQAVREVNEYLSKKDD